MISPTIGRVVLVHREFSGSDQAEPALVTYVHNDRLINVGGFDHLMAGLENLRIELFLVNHAVCLRFRDIVYGNDGGAVERMDNPVNVVLPDCAGADNA